MNSVLMRYAQHGPITDPREQADLFTDLPSDIGALCAVVDGLLIHPIGAQMCNIKLGEEQLHDQTIRPIARTLGRIRELDPRPLNKEYNSDMSQLLDRVAALAVADDHAISELHHLYEHDARLRAPATLTISNEVLIN